MRTSVGKPTLRNDEPKPVPKLIQVNFRVRREARNRLGDRESVAGANHCCDPFLALLWVRRNCCKRANPSSTRKIERGIDRRIVRERRGVSSVRLLDSRVPQLVDQPPLAIAAGGQ